MRSVPLVICLFLSQFSLSQNTVVGPSPKPNNGKEPVKVEFSHQAGFYDAPFDLELSTPGGRIHYTLDGSTPTRKSKKYRGPIRISKTTIVRAAAYSGRRKSKLHGRTFFVNEVSSTFPTVSIGITPSLLFDPESGLYLKGPGVIDSLWRKDGANFWSRKELRVHFEFFETDGKCEFSSGTGFRLFGGVSRLFPQKSMTVVARDRYGKKRIKHRVFGKKGLKKFKFLVLRNSGSDWGKTQFRDAMITSLAEGWGLDVQDSRPSHVYLNGEYWGIYNLREKINKYYLEDHHDVDADSIDLIEHKYSLKQGSRQHYLKMLRYLGKNSMADSDNFAHLSKQMDVDNFMNYQIMQIFIDNRDAGGNIKYWKSKNPSSKWRWILYDTDWGFGLHFKDAYKFNSLDFHTRPDGPEWPNPPWSTFILRKLLKNPTFKADFINRFCDRMNTSLSTKFVLARIDKFVEKYEPEMPRQFDRWNTDPLEWEDQVERMKEFAINRPFYMRKFLREKFDLNEDAEVVIATNAGGKVILNDAIKISNKTFAGQYFQGLPLSLKAIPKYGYRFSHWKGLSKESDRALVNIELVPKKAYTKIEAVFEQYMHPLSETIIINEISPRDKAAGDWVELFNRSEETVSLGGWMFTDNKNTFKLPNAELAGKSHLVLCQNLEDFKKTYPGVENAVGSFGFGLNKKGEQLALYDSKGASIDSVKYLVEPLDTTFTVSLILPHLENGDPENWQVELGLGTPEAMNPKFLESSIKTAQNMWIRIGVGLGLAMCALIFFIVRKTFTKEPSA